MNTVEKEKSQSSIGQLFFSLLSPLPVLSAADRLTGTQTCSTNDWSSTFCHQQIERAMDSCWQILSNPVIVIYMLAGGLLSHSHGYTVLCKFTVMRITLVLFSNSTVFDSGWFNEDSILISKGSTYHQQMYPKRYFGDAR